MTCPNPVGLVGAGGVSRSFLARMPAVLARLGPIKASSLRLSRRLANQLRAGRGVANYSELAGCSVIWIYGPEKTLDRVAAELSRGIPLEGKMVVLMDVMRDSLQPSPLRAAGARVATVSVIPACDERIFAVEGAPAVTAELRKMLAVEQRMVIELKPACKTLYLSGVHVAAHLLMPLIAGSAESFRAAGFTRSEAIATVQSLASRALRAYARAGAKAWNRADAETLYRAIEADMETIRLTDHRLAALYTDSAERLLRSFKKPAAKRLHQVTAARAS